MNGLVLALLLWSADAPAVDVSTLEGRSVSGQLEALTAETLKLARDGGSVSVPVADLLEVRTAAAAPPAPSGEVSQTVTLQDGSRIRCGKFSVTGQSLSLEHPDWGTLTVPVTQARTLLFVPEDPQLASAWKQLTERTSKKDMVVIRKGDVLDHLDGVVGAINDATVNFLLDGDQIPIKRERIYGVIYSSKEGGGAKDGVRVEFAGGDVLLSKHVTWTEKGWHINRSGTREFDVPSTNILRLDYSQGKVQYLSAMEPRDVKYTPYYDYVFEYQRDRHLFGGPLRIGGRTYTRGLAIHSKTLLRYRLGGEYRRFTAVMGFDPEVKFDPRRPDSRAQVRFEIRGDGRVLFGENVFAGDAPQNLDLPVDGVNDLELLVDFGDNSDIGDRLHLGEAKVIK